MKQNEVEILAKNLTTRFGLEINGRVENNTAGQLITFRPVGIHPNESFSIELKIGWRSIELEFKLGKFAAELLSEMELKFNDVRDSFVYCIRSIILEKGGVILTINNISVNLEEPMFWPKGWSSFDFTLRKSPLEINTENHFLTEELITYWTLKFYSTIINLLPLENISGELQVELLPEGAKTKIEVNKYERDARNRSICISFLGVNCKVCDINFYEKYGETGKDFIHVHHIIPVSKMGDGYLVNPIKDLVPVCPNCHAMIHRRDPPFTIEEVRAKLGLNE